MKYTKNDNYKESVERKASFTNDLMNDAKLIVESARKYAYRVADAILVQRNWLLGKRISIEVLKGEKRADYGAEIIKNLSKELTALYGKGFSKSNLYSYVKFCEFFPDIFQTMSGKSAQPIFQTPSGKSRLSWSHFSVLLQVADKEARQWYAREAEQECWGVRTLQRNVSSQYYYRMLQTYDKQSVRDEMHQLTAPLQDKLEYIKSPIIAEFLGLGKRTDYQESTLESSILSHLQDFLMELGKGYAFVARQQHVHTEKRDYYIDLVFYNIFLKCYVLIDLKTTVVTHQDVGQMDMYVRMYDELKRVDGDNPTIGILLCADTDDDIARFSVLKGNEQLFASKYITYMPSKEQLREEIERQKMFYLLQREEIGGDTNDEINGGE